MTIYGVGYRSLQYQPESRLRRLWPIVSLEFRTLFRARFGVALFFICLIPAIVSLVALLIRIGVLNFENEPMQHRLNRLPPAAVAQMSRWDPYSVNFYVEPIVSPTPEGWLPFLLLTVLVTARAVAKDRTTNALELYWTRGIRPRGYMAAKWFGSFLLLSLFTVMAPLVLWLTGMLLADDLEFLRKTVTFMPQALGGLTLFTALLSYQCIALSALAGSPNLAAILWCLLIVSTSVLAQIVEHLAKVYWLADSLSIWDTAGTLARACAGMPMREGKVWGSAITMTGVTLILTFLLRRRLRLQEAIG